MSDLLKNLQEITCVAIENNSWMESFINQVVEAAKKGERSVVLNVADTPAKAGTEQWNQLIDYFMMHGLSVDIKRDCDIFVSWSPCYHYNMSQTDRIELALQGIAYVGCQLTEAILTEDEEAKRAIIEEVRVIANGLPEGFIGFCTK